MTRAKGRAEIALEHQTDSAFRQKLRAFGQVLRSTNRRMRYTDRMKTILVPIDFSAVSGVVVDEAATLARALSGRVVLLTVIQPPVITSEYAPLMENISEFVAAGEKTAAKKLAKLAEQLEAKSIAAETLQFNGAPVTNIVEQAEKLSADYIVMGSHGHSAVYDLLVGSTTHGVLMRSKCPVVIVPPENPKAKP